MHSRAIALWAAVLILAASFQAPHAHIHAGEDHHGGFGHAHWAHAEQHHHDSDGPEIELVDEDETAVSVEWTPEAPHRFALDFGATAVPWQFRPQPVRSGSVAELIPSSHSPPARRLLPARAPPV